MHDLDTEHGIATELDRVTSEKLLKDLGRGFDAIFGETLPRCACGAFTKSGHAYGCANAPIWHDDDQHRQAEASRAASEQQRESAEYASAERGTVL